jgi:hypothetical protein
MNGKIFGVVAEKKNSDSGMLFTFTEQMLDYQRSVICAQSGLEMNINVTYDKEVLPTPAVGMDSLEQHRQIWRLTFPNQPEYAICRIRIYPVLESIIAKQPKTGVFRPCR